MNLEQLNLHFTSLLQEKGYELCELTFKKENNELTLHFAIDKIDGIMDLDATVSLSELISIELDNLNWGDEPYTLDVSSAGAERSISVDNFEKYIGKYINIHLVNPIDGENYIEGELTEVNSDEIIIIKTIKTRKKNIKVVRANIDKARLAIKF